MQAVDRHALTHENEKRIDEDLGKGGSLSAQPPSLLVLDVASVTVRVIGRLLFYAPPALSQARPGVGKCSTTFVIILLLCLVAFLVT